MNPRTKSHHQTEDESDSEDSRTAQVPALSPRGRYTTLKIYLLITAACLLLSVLMHVILHNQ